jgi:alpha-mannosidase
MIAALKSHCPIVVCLLALSGTVLFAGRAAAQSATDAGKIAASLDPESRVVIERLSGLRELPDGVWKLHAGDLAHGEAVALDEGSWQPIAVGGKAPNEAVWFRQAYQVPATLNGYDLTGARIWFQFHADANGPMPEILYFNGRRVAMGESDLEPVVLFDNAKPGDKVVIATQFFETVNTKNFRGATLRIDFPENRPNPEDLRQEFLSAALLIPTLAPNDPAQMATLNGAIRAVDLAALDALDQNRFDASLKAARGKLEALRPLLQQATFHLTGNSHIDAAWLWPWTETVDVVKRTFGTALQLMNEYSGYTFAQSAAAYNEWLADKYPLMNAGIKRRAQEGRWEIVGGMWVEPDLNMPDGESLVRQLLVGKRWYRQAYGVDVRIGWNPDSFGYTWQLPQIYKKSGVDYFVTQKMTWSDTNQLPFKLFWWESPDGSKVLAYFPHDYANDNLNPVRLANDLAAARTRATGETEMMDLYGIGDHGGGPTRVMLDQGFHWARGSQAGSSCLVNGHDFTGRGETPHGQQEVSGHDFTGREETPHGQQEVSGHDFSRAESASSTSGALAPVDASSCPIMPKYEFGTAQSFFSAIEKQIAPESRVWDYQSIARGYTPPPAVAGKVNIPTWKSELYFEYHRGVMTTQANHKRNMRESEEQVLNAEKWASLAWLGGQSYPGAELTEDWKKVLFNQFHDMAAGSGIADIYKDAQKDYDWVRMSTNEISAGALGTVAERIDTQSRSSVSVPVIVWNPVGWKRSGDVTVKFQSSSPEIKSYLWTWNEKGDSVGSTHIIARDAATGVVTLRISNVSAPAVGYAVIHLIPITADMGFPAKAEESSDSKGYVLEDHHIHVTIDKATGCITSILSKSDHSETIASGACGNQLQFFKDTPKDYDAWNIDPETLDQAPAIIDNADSVEQVTDDEGFPAIRVARHWQSSKFIQTISLGSWDSDQVDIDNEIDWHESHVLLKAAFPLAASGPFATYEIPYGAIDRPTTRNNSWEQAQFEVPAMRWADLGGIGSDGKQHGLSVLNQTKYGYDAVGNVLRLTLLRSPKWPDPEADMGHHHFHYALYPHAGTWKDALTVRHGYEYNYPLTAVVTTAHAGSLPAEHSFASVEPENVVLTAVKKAEDQNGLGVNGLILRVYEWAGKESTVEFHVPPGATGATVTNLMETPEGGPLAVTGDVVKAAIHPYEILTIRVDYPNGGPKE